MRWLVIGGTSGIGRRVVEQLAASGAQVRAFGRSAADAGFVGETVEPFKGDALSEADVSAALVDVDVVVQALGIKERPGMLWEQENLFSSATRVLLPAMKEAGVSRLITVTGYGAGESADSMSLLVRIAHKAVLGRVYEDKTRQEALIRSSDLDWTIIRPTLLNEGSLTKRYKVLANPASWRLGTISRADVAHFVVRAGEKALNIGEAVVLA